MAMIADKAHKFNDSVDDIAQIALGHDPSWYAKLIPFDLAINQNCVVIDLFEGCAIVASTNPVSEEIHDELYAHGLFATLHLSQSSDVLDWQFQVYRHDAATKAEITGQSRHGVIRFLQRESMLRAVLILSPLVLLFVTLSYFPALAFACGAIFLCLIIAIRTALSGNSLPQLKSQYKIPDQLPTISVLVPLFKEAEILPKLILRLQRIKYPAANLDILILMEQSVNGGLKTCHFGGVKVGQLVPRLGACCPQVASTFQGVLAVRPI